jgi:hypothetical protein
LGLRLSRSARGVGDASVAGRGLPALEVVWPEDVDGFWFWPWSCRVSKVFPLGRGETDSSTLAGVGMGDWTRAIGAIAPLAVCGRVSVRVHGSEGGKV